MSLDKVKSGLQAKLRDCERLMGELAPEKIEGQDRVIFARLLFSIRNLSSPEDIPEAARCLEEVEALHSSLLQRRQMELEAAEDAREEVAARLVEEALFATGMTPRNGTTEWGAANRTGKVANSQGLKVDVVWLQKSLEGSIQSCRILLSELESIFAAPEDAVNYSRTRWRLNDLSFRGSGASDKASLTNYLKEVLSLRDSLLQSISNYYEDAAEAVPQHIREAARFTIPNQPTQPKSALRFAATDPEVVGVKIITPPAVSNRPSSTRAQIFTQSDVKRENHSNSSPDQSQVRFVTASVNQPISTKLAAILAKSTRNIRDTSDIGSLQAILKTLIVDCQLLIQEVDVDRLPANERADYSRRLWTAGQAELPGSPIEVKRALLGQLEDIANLKGALLWHINAPVTDSNAEQPGDVTLELPTAYTPSGAGRTPQPSSTRNWQEQGKTDALREQSLHWRPAGNVSTHRESGDVPKQLPARFASGSTSMATPPQPPPPPPPLPPAPPSSAQATVPQAKTTMVCGSSPRKAGAQIETKPDKAEPLSIQIFPNDHPLSVRSPLVAQQKGERFTPSSKTTVSRPWSNKSETPLAESLKPLIGSTAEQNQQVVDEYMQLLQFKNGWLPTPPPPIASAEGAKSDSEDWQLSLHKPPTSPALDRLPTNKIPVVISTGTISQQRNFPQLRNQLDDVIGILEIQLNSASSISMSMASLRIICNQLSQVSRQAKTSKYYVMISPYERVPSALSAVVGGSAPPSPATIMKSNIPSAAPRLRFVCEHIYQKEHPSGKDQKQI
ncbi:unnamed protein product [Schistocephalus solidus]|uniref:Uncharacterized protein n=1 Tax=Schistocephalus solidus TaxID=70667 RepID=A0A183SN38_SCHSO|nr:unnamed protein product [Schistocephalus solidus]